LTSPLAKRFAISAYISPGTPVSCRDAEVGIGLSEELTILPSDLYASHITVQLLKQQQTIELLQAAGWSTSTLSYSTPHLGAHQFGNLVVADSCLSFSQAFLRLLDAGHSFLTSMCSPTIWPQSGFIRSSTPQAFPLCLSQTMRHSPESNGTSRPGWSPPNTASTGHTALASFPGGYVSNQMHDSPPICHRNDDVTTGISTCICGTIDTGLTTSHTPLHQCVAPSIYPYGAQEVAAAPMRAQSQSIPKADRPRCYEHGCEGRAFSCIENYRRHLKEKSGLSTVVCLFCNRQFTRKSNMEKHIVEGKCNVVKSFDDAAYVAM
jgi:hypothetical protein